MEISEVIKTTKFVAALSGVVAGFFFTLLSDLARSMIRRKVKRCQVSSEVKMIREDSLSAVLTYIENDNIERGSKKAPLMHAALDSDIFGDKNFLLDAGVSIKQRRSLRSVRLICESIDQEYDNLKDYVLKYSRKHEWEGVNTRLCHYFAFIVYSCDEFLNRIDPMDDPMNGEQFDRRNEIVLSQVEKKCRIKIPRDSSEPA